MKIIRSLNVHKKLASLGLLFSLGYLGINFLDAKIEEIYKNRKLGLEREIRDFIDKDIVLGSYEGLRFFGFGISNSKIFDNKNKNSKIEAEKVYLGVMPIRSFFNQKWIINIKPQKTSINVNRDFLKQEKLPRKEKNLFDNRVNFDLNFHLKDFTKLKINDLDIKTQFKGKFKYSSKPSQISGSIDSKFTEKDNLKIKFNSKLDQDFFKLELLTKAVDLSRLNIKNINSDLAFKGGTIRSNLKYYKSSRNSYCKGGLSLNKLELKAKNLEEYITSDFIRLSCKNNNLTVKTNKLKYGSLLSKLNLNVPLNNSINKINLDGIIKYSANPKSKITLSGSMPYWFDKRGFNFGKINSSFDLTRTELANLNIFRKNGIKGLITAKGSLRGNVFDPELKVDFNVDTPNYKGIRFRETWVGEISNVNNNYLVNIQSRSPIPSFLTLNFDSNIKLDNLEFSRLFSANKGTLNIVRNDNNYSWEAINLPLDELEFSPNNIKFDRISGTINGSGILSTDLSKNDGRIGWSYGKYRNLDLRTSYFDFKIKDNEYFVDAFVIPEDGGIVKILVDSNKDKILNIDFDNISSRWSILNAINTFKIDENNLKANGMAKILNVEGISNQGKTLVEQIKLINEYKKNKKLIEKNSGFEEFFRRYESRYSGNVIISGDNNSNYKIASEINGFVDLKINDVLQNKKEYFSIDLKGGLFEGKGDLVINQIPLKSINIFLKEPKDFEGAIDLKLKYDLDKKYFKTTKLSFKNTSIKKYDLDLNNSSIEFNKDGRNRFDLDISLFFNDIDNPIKLIGYVPFSKNGILDLKLNGESQLLKLLDIFYGENINFKKGNVVVDMRMRGPINQPIFNADLEIKDSEIDIFKNNLKNVNTNINVIGDQVKINSFTAKGDKKGTINIFGNLPIYEEKISNKKSISFVSNKFNLVSKNNDLNLDSFVKVSGSFFKPTLEGKIALSDGFVNIKSSNKKRYKNGQINKRYGDKNSLKERFWDQNKDVEVISNEEIKISKLITSNLKQEYLYNINFDNLKVFIGPDFRLGYTNNINTISAYLETVVPLVFNESLRDENEDFEVDLKIRGLININRGKLRTALTPFKFVKNNNSILFAKRLGINPFVNFNLTAKVPEPIMPISQNIKDGNISKELNNNDSSDLGTIGIGNSRTIKIDASYSGIVSKISTNEEFENFWFNRLKFRSSPSRSRSEIISLIGGNSSNLINRAFISQLDGENAFSERFQLSLYPALIENNEPMNNVFSNQNSDINNSQGSATNSSSSSQAWVAEIGLDITNQLNFAVQTTPDRDDLPPLGILTIQANEYLELLGSYDSDGDWKSQVQLFFRY